MKRKMFFLALSRLLDMVHVNLANHQIRVAYITWKLGEVLNLSPIELDNLIVASLIHDIGAMRVEDKLSIISDDLDEDNHGEKGWFVFKKNNLEEEVAIIVKNHHKSYEELGDKDYLSQILNFADYIEKSIDKNVSNFYQKDRLKRLLKNRVGKQFNPKVYEAFEVLAKKDSFWFALEDTNIAFEISKSPIIEKEIDNPYKYAKLTRDILDFRSPYTVKHSTSVMMCSRVVGENLGLESEKLKKLVLASLMHDIGKIVVPNEILEKEGPLNPEEVYEVKKHAYYTYQFLSGAQFDEDVVKWASYHHEVPNGNGYPFGFKGEEIPFESRIMAFCDIFVALTEDRPYRKGMDKNKIKEIMLKMAYCDKEVEVVNIIFENYQKIFNLVRDEFDEIGKGYEEILNT